MTRFRVLAPGLLVLLTTTAAPAAAPGHLVVAHRLADERAARESRGEAPSATVGDETRYVLAPALIVPVALGAVPVVAPDGTLTLSLPCPEALAGQDSLLSVALPTKSITKTARLRCPPAGGPPFEMRVPGLPPGERLIAVVNALGLPERIETDAFTPPAGARLRLALGLAGNRPDEKPAPVRFRVSAESSARPKPVALLDRTLDVARVAADRSWVEVEVALDPARAALGGALRLVFQTEVGGAAAGFPVWGDPLVLAPAPARAPEPWNVVLVSLDTLRGDRLGCYGNRRATSPTLDRLAAEGTLFPVTVAAASWTLPSHVSLMTGLSACAHGLVSGGGLGHRLTPGARPLATLVRARGYATAGFTEDGFLEPGVFQPGFGTYRADGSPNNKLKVEATIAAARAWIEANARLPFLLFVHTYQIHAPYGVPDSYRQMFTTYEGPDGPHPLGGSPGNLQELATYDTAVRYTDDVLAGLLATLHTLDLDRHTIVVVTSDHGEAFWEHGLSGHGKTLYEEEIRIPLIWRAPGLIAAGRRVPRLAGSTDVLPTLLDLLGIATPDVIQGQSLAAWLRAGSPEAAGPDERVLFSETSLEGYHLAARGSTWKALLAGDQTPRFFQLDTDPGEQHPEPSSPTAEVATQARARFDADCARVKARLAEAAPAAATPAPPLNPEHERNLRALGYVN